MSNILDAIQVSGASYDLKDKNAPSVSSLTQSEYDNLPSTAKTSNTFFVITDAQAGDLTQYWTSAQTQSAITQATSGLQETLVSGTNIKTINNENILGSGNIDIQGGGGVTTGEVQTMIDENISGKTDITTFTAYTAATDTALANKQTTLTAGTNITIVDNVISATGGGGGGGKAIEAGRGISITTGETADTVSFNLPISADSSNNITIGALNLNDNKGKGLNFLFGSGNAIKTPANYNGNFNCIFGLSNEVGKVQGRYATQYNAMFGYSNHCYLNNSLICGNNNATYNNSEFSSGQYNNSVSGSSTFGDSGNTLFSVGNGTSASARHNAFEIRQNGDIYCSDGTNDVKLQDTITATAANTTALGGLKLVKLSQSEYDSLVTKDNSTLYVIVN